MDYGPFDAGVGASRSEDFWRSFMRHLTRDGVIAGERSEGAVTERAAGANMSVDVAALTGFLRGHWFDETATTNKAISNGDASNPRIDRIVVRADFTANTISIEVLEGTPDVTPAAPSLTQSTSRWEISLAQIAVVANESTEVVNADITDERDLISFPIFGDITAAAEDDTFVRNADGLWVPSSAASAPADSDSDVVAAAEGTTSTSFTDLATPGPAVTVTTGTKVLVIVSARVSNGTGGRYSSMGFAISGATSLVADEARALRNEISAGDIMRASAAYLATVTAGSNTFTAKYLSESGGSATFADRELIVIPLN